MELTSDFDGYATAKPIGNEAKGRLSVVTDIHPFFTKIDLLKWESEPFSHGESLSRTGAVGHTIDQYLIKVSLELEKVPGTILTQDAIELTLISFPDLQYGFFSTDFICRVIGPGKSYFFFVLEVYRPEGIPFRLVQIKLWADESHFQCL
jgi:hypothetical protein